MKERVGLIQKTGVDAKKKSTLHKCVSIEKRQLLMGKKCEAKRNFSCNHFNNCSNCSLIIVAEPLTSLTVRLSFLHVKGLVPDGSLAGRTLEALNMVGHLQGVHDFLTK